MDSFTGKFREVNPFDIVVDHRYQRDAKQQLIYAIAREFTWEAFGAPVCFERTTGVLYCADGQQRIEAVKIMEDPPKKVPVLVFSGADLVDEAAVFGRINEFRKGLTPMEKHKGKLVAKDPAATAIQEAVEAAGYTLQPGTKGENNIQAIGTLSRVYNELGQDGVMETLLVVREAWPDTNEGTSRNMLRLVQTLIVEAGDEFDRRLITDALSGVTPSRIERKAEEMKYKMGGSTRTNIRRAVQDMVGL